VQLLLITVATPFPDDINIDQQRAIIRARAFAAGLNPRQIAVEVSLITDAAGDTPARAWQHYLDIRGPLPGLEEKT
jgi:hypothetical protein